MIATLKFNLPEETHEHLCAVHGQDLLFAISDYDQWLREQAKHGGKSTVTIEDARAMLRELLDERTKGIWDGL